MKRRALACYDDDEDEEADYDFRNSKRTARDLKKSETAWSSVGHVDNIIIGDDTVAKPKEKEFAWMDSDDEDGDEDRDSLTAEVEENEAANAEISLEILDDVQSFGRMVLLTPALLKHLRDGKMDDGDIVAAACRALARTKFFDREVLDGLHEVLKRLLRLEKLNIAQSNDAVQCLWGLNDYDQAVFSAVALAFRFKTALIAPTMRSSWRDIFKNLGHDHEKDFLQFLEAPPVLQGTPGFKHLRCRHDSKGCCVMGQACTFSHDHHAPFTFGLETITVGSRHNPVIMTQTQEHLGAGSYGYRGGPMTSGQIRFG